jgi:hypothetical protein
MALLQAANPKELAMRRFCTVLICFACIDLCNAFATDGSPLPTNTDDQSRHELETLDVDGPLFDYPISRALGIDVPAMLAPRVAKPSVYDLAPIANS